MMQAVLRKSLPLAGLALLVLPGCDVEFPEEEVRLRYDAASDTLDVLFIYSGVHTPEATEEALKDGVAVADRILAGRREFMLLDWPYLWDLDEMAEDEETLLPYRRLIDRVSLLEVGAFLDNGERLSAWQHFRMKEVTPSLKQANQALALFIQLGALTGDLQENLPWVDDEELELWTEDARMGVQWIRFEDGGLVVDVPMSELASVRALSMLTQQAMKEAAGEEELVTVAMLFENVHSMRIADGRAVFRLGQREGEQTVFQLRRGDAPYDDALLTALQARGLDLSAAPSLAEVRSRLQAGE